MNNKSNFKKKQQYRSAKIHRQISKPRRARSKKEYPNPPNEKFLEVSEPFYKKVLTRRRQKWRWEEVTFHDLSSWPISLITPGSKKITIIHEITRKSS